MRKVEHPSTVSEPVDEDGSVPAEPREIIIPHDPALGPVTAVRNVLVQSSLAELRTHGYYERYTTLIAPDILEQLLGSLGPGWISLELALAHYEACDNLQLSTEEFEAMGKRVGDRVQGTMLVSVAKRVREANFDLWAAVLPLHRMWARLFQGGSVQVVKVGPRDKLLEQRGFLITRYHYYREAHVAALRSIYSALGARVAYTTVARYSEAKDEMVVRVAWL